MKDALSRIARTAALCGTLGVALYLIMSGLAELPFFAPIFGLVAAALLVALTGAIFWDALRTGVFPVRPTPQIRRDSQPVAYWSFMTWTLLCALASLALVVFLGARLLEA